MRRKSTTAIHNKAKPAGRPISHHISKATAAHRLSMVAMANAVQTRCCGWFGTAKRLDMAESSAFKTIYYGVSVISRHFRSR